MRRTNTNISALGTTAGHTAKTRHSTSYSSPKPRRVLDLKQNETRLPQPNDIWPQQEKAFQRDANATWSRFSHRNRSKQSKLWHSSRQPRNKPWQANGSGPKRRSDRVQKQEMNKNSDNCKKRPTRGQRKWRSRFNRRPNSTSPDPDSDLVQLLQKLKI